MTGRHNFLNIINSEDENGEFTEVLNSRQKNSVRKYFNKSEEHILQLKVNFFKNKGM